LLLHSPWPFHVWHWLDEVVSLQPPIGTFTITFVHDLVHEPAQLSDIHCWFAEHSPVLAQ